MSTAVQRIDPASTPMQQPRHVRPVLWWASAGVLSVLFQLYLYGRWIGSDHFRSSPLGKDPVPQWEKTCAWIMQPTFTLGALLVAAWVIRGCVREGRLTFDGKLTIAWYSIIWLDPVGNYVRPQFMFNAYYVNRGSWVEGIPGWISPNGSNLADALLMEIPAYGMAVMAAVGTCRLMRAIQRRRPHTGKVGLIGAAWVTSGVLIVAFEAPLCMRTGWASWSATALPDWLVIWPGTRWQVPLIPDPIFWSLVFTAMAALRFYRDDAGRSAVDRGLERTRLTVRAKTVVSTLAVVGFANIAMGLHTIPSVWASFYLHKTVEVPSYMRAGVCGKGTSYDCPGPDKPIKLPTNPPGASLDR
jgi:Spirocyclase AveC-like